MQLHSWSSVKPKLLGCLVDHFCINLCSQLAAGIASFWACSPLCSTARGSHYLYLGVRWGHPSSVHCCPLALACTPKPVLTSLASSACNWRRARLPATQPPLPAVGDVHNCPCGAAGRPPPTSSPCCLQLEVCREQAQWAQAEKRTFLRQRIDSRLANLYLETRDYQAAIALITKLLTEVGPDLLGGMLTVAPCLALGAHMELPYLAYIIFIEQSDADRGISSSCIALRHQKAAH